MAMSFLGLREMILCQGLHDCISIAKGQVKEVDAHLKGRYKHPSIYRRVLKTIRHSLIAEFQLSSGRATRPSTMLKY